jgi:hypothetical protein
MTCETVLPEKRQYRLNWYLAWQRPGDKAPKVPKGDVLDLAAASPADIRANEGGVFRLDPALVGVAEACLRQETSEAFIRGDAPTAPCWQSNGTQKALRKLVRPLIALDTPGTLVVGPLDPAACWVPNHFDRNQQRGLPHWDLCSILDFAVWARQGLGPEWTIVPDSAMAATLPSMAGLLGETGFGKDEDMGE